jgi:4-hydroxy-3-polyprenylbenzoate decarboxylase
MRVHKVYARKNAIWSFTVVGRPPQEDTSFGQLIHEIAGGALQQEIPGLKEVNAVDAAGVHPLLLAIGSERYTPYAQTKQPAELLTIANHILGTGQLSLAKFLFITADDSNKLTTHHIKEYMQFILQRINLQRDVHFYTNTTIDTLDYSGTGLNTGSKVVFAAYGPTIRELATEPIHILKELKDFENPQIVMPGVLVLQTTAFANYDTARDEMNRLDEQLKDKLELLENIPFIMIADDARFVSESLNNFLWIAFTRCNPSHDIYGIQSFTKNKHWGCNGPLVLDARIKPHHAPPLVKDPVVEKSIDKLFEKGGSLYGIS